MTIRLPKKTVVDDILARLGKRRAVYVGGAYCTQFLPYPPHIRLRKEPVLKSLLRKQGEALEEGWVYVEDVQLTDSGWLKWGEMK